MFGCTAFHFSPLLAKKATTHDVTFLRNQAHYWDRVFMITRVCVIVNQRNSDTGFRWCSLFHSVSSGLSLYSDYIEHEFFRFHRKGY